MLIFWRFVQKKQQTNKQRKKNQLSNLSEITFILRHIHIRHSTVVIPIIRSNKNPKMRGIIGQDQSTHLG